MKFLLIILSFLALQTSTYSSTSEDNKFNQKYLSNYFSALVSSGNQKNEAALDYFNSSKFLIQKHDNFLKKYVFSLVLNGQVKKGIDQIKISKNDILIGLSASGKTKFTLSGINYANKIGCLPIGITNNKNTIIIL